MQESFKYLEKNYPILVRSKADFKYRFIQEFVDEAIHEIQWKLVDLSNVHKNQAILGLIIDGDKINFFHAPYCRCHECPFHDDEKLRLARVVHKESPWGKFVINPSVCYAFVGNSMDHMPFCECANCKKMPANIVPKYARQMMTKILLHSPYDAFDLVAPHLMRPKLFQWRKNTIDIAIQHVQKQNNNSAGNVNQDNPFGQDAKRIKLSK